MVLHWTRYIISVGLGSRGSEVCAGGFLLVCCTACLFGRPEEGRRDRKGGIHFCAASRDWKHTATEEDKATKDHITAEEEDGLPGLLDILLKVL